MEKHFLVCISLPIIRRRSQVLPATLGAKRRRGAQSRRRGIPAGRTMHGTHAQRLTTKTKPSTLPSSVVGRSRAPSDGRIGWINPKQQGVKRGTLVFSLTRTPFFYTIFYATIISITSHNRKWLVTQLHPLCS